MVNFLQEKPCFGKSVIFGQKSEKSKKFEFVTKFLGANPNFSIQNLQNSLIRNPNPHRNQKFGNKSVWGKSKFGLRNNGLNRPQKKEVCLVTIRIWPVLKDRFTATIWTKSCFPVKTGSGLVRESIQSLTYKFWTHKFFRFLVKNCTDIKLCFWRGKNFERQF